MEVADLVPFLPEDTGDLRNRNIFQVAEFDHQGGFRSKLLSEFPNAFKDQPSQGEFARFLNAVGCVGKARFLKLDGALTRLGQFHNGKQRAILRKAEVEPMVDGEDLEGFGNREAFNGISRLLSVGRVR